MRVIVCGGRGTADMVEKAKAALIPVRMATREETKETR